MKTSKAAVWFVSLVLILGGLGCATTPDSIKALGAMEVQMLRAMEKDVELIVDRYDAEVRHWSDLAFRQALQKAEGQLVKEDGTVVLAEYKNAVREVAAQMAASTAQYDKNKADILDAMAEKFDKSMLMMALINEYEQSTGTSPETWAAVTTELGGLAVDINSLYEQLEAQRRAEEAAAAPTMRDRLNLMGNGIFDMVYDRMTDALSGGGTLLPPPPAPPVEPLEEPVE